MQTSIHRRPLSRWPLSLTVLAGALAIWLLLGTNSEPNSGRTVGWVTDTSCLTEFDALRAADRSRNGVSISCNSETLSSLTTE